MLELEWITPEMIRDRRHYKKTCESIENCKNLLDVLTYVRRNRIFTYRNTILRAGQYLWYCHEIHAIRATIRILKKDKERTWKRIIIEETEAYEREQDESQVAPA